MLDLPLHALHFVEGFLINDRLVGILFQVHMLLFSPYLGENSAAVLLLFRLVTYYAQFLLGCGVFLWCSWRNAAGDA